jgi:alpha-L-fucosidase
VQRRTLEGVASWLTAIKPLTIGRRVIGAGEVEVTDAAWCRAWATPDGVVAIVDGPETSVRARDGRDVAVVPLPA